MADTRCQLECEDWVRLNWLPQRYGQKFHRERVKLSSGGVFDFDAVSADAKIVATISTSGGKTASGKHAVGKLMKLRSDMLFLLLAAPEKALVVLTEQDMYQLCIKEKAGGRVPQNVEFVHAPLPDDLALKLLAARKVSSDEMGIGKSAGSVPPTV